MNRASGTRPIQEGATLRRRRGGPNADPPPHRGPLYRPGQPIGYFSAHGSPYQKKYLGKKLSFCCLWVAPPVLIVSLVIALVPVIWALADHTLSVAQISITQANLTSLTNTSFPLSLHGESSKTGIFPATLYFREPLDVFWMSPPPNMRELHLGTFHLGRISIASGHGKVIQSTHFNITDPDHFGEFTSYLVTQPRFTWNLVCNNTHVEAFGFFPPYKNYVFQKHVLFKGIDNFHDVQLLDFQLPGNDPQGGITFQALTSLVNSSPFAIQVGYLDVGLYYKDMYLGPATTSGPINITTGPNTILLLGHLTSHSSNETELNLLGELFTTYINGGVAPVIARGEAVTLENGDKISWLSQGIRALSINVPLQSAQSIGPIKSIEIDEFSIIFTEDQPWTPSAFSNRLKADIGLPFGFQLNIISTQNNIQLMYNNSVVGVVEGVFSNSTLNLDVVNAGSTAGTLDLTLSPSPLQIGGNTTAEQRWIEYEKVLVFGVNTSTRLRGQSHALTDTPVGRIFLSPINFDVESGLTGLQGLNSYPTVISSVDLTGGTHNALTLAIQTTITNPSNLNLSTGNVEFHLVNDQIIGNVTMYDLHLDLGENNVTADALFDPRAGEQGQVTLNRFVSGEDTKLYINGFDGSSNVSSLNPTLALIRINTILPGLRKTLVSQAQLEVLPTTGITNDSANALVSIANPFSAGITITHIQSQVYAHGIRIAHIDYALNFVAKGNATSVSPNIPLDLNLYPPDIFGAVRAYAIQAGLDPSFIDGITAVGGYNLTPTVDNASSTGAHKQALSPSHLAELGKRYVFDDMMEKQHGDNELYKWAELSHTKVHRLHKRNMYHNFNLTNYVAEAFAHAEGNLTILADANVGDYNTTLDFVQQNAPLKTDNTLFYLLPVLARPIVQKIVDQAILSIDTATVLDPQETSFEVHLQGTLTEAGPFDGLVHFPQGLQVNYQGRLLGQVAFPNITLIGDVGSTIDVTAPFQVANTSFMQDFTIDALNNPSFSWNIAAQGIVVDALDITIPNISLSKNVVLSGFNGLKKQVQISSFDLPGDDPAGGIHLDVSTLINNPSQLGMELSRFGVNVEGNGSFLGPAGASNMFTLAALTQTHLNLTGTLVSQNNSQALQVLSNVFTNFVHNQPTGLVVRGDYAGPTNVTWINNAIKTLSIPVTLPSVAFNVIRGVTLNQLSLAFTPSSAWDPSTSSVNTTAPFYLPFSFPINITQVQGQFIANYNSHDAAVLNIPASHSNTDVSTRVLSLAFNNVPFQVYDDAHPVFSQFLSDATLKSQIDFGLHGTATTEADTAAGVVTISDVPFAVNTSILGLQGFNARPANVSDLDVVHGYSSYLQIDLNAHLFNPSDITISTGDVQFQTLYDNHPIGPAVITNLMAVPAENSIPASLRYNPQGNANVQAGQTVLNNYVGNVTTEAVIAGYDNSTQVPSLSTALQGIRLNTLIPPLNKLLITEGNLTVPTNIDNDPTTYVTVNVANPFTASLNIKTILSSPVYNNLTVGAINTDLNPPIHAPGRQDTISQDIPMELNTNPKALVSLLLQVAQASGTSLGPWPPFLQRVLDLPGNASTQVKAMPGGDMSSCPANGAFDFLSAMLQALKGLAVKIPIVTNTDIDDYGVTLNFTQDPVPIHTDRSALYLLGPAGAPLIQQFVDQAGLSFSQGNISHVTDTGFTVHLQGALQLDAPVNALINFTSPLEIRWNGDFIATISLPTICTLPGQGVPNLITTGQVSIVNQEGFTKFATYILHNEEFTWDISTSDLSVLALGITFSQINLNKNVTFKAFNGLPGVTTNNLNIPGEGEDFLDITVDAAMPSPATLGIELNTAKLSLFFQGTRIGQAQANDLTLAPESVTPITLAGQLVRQTSQTDLDNLGILFSNFLQGQNLSLTAQGMEVDTPYQNNGRVAWLSDAFSTLQLDVTLEGKIYEVIFAVSILDLELELVKDPSQIEYNIPVSCKTAIGEYANPFHFTIVPEQASANVTISFENVAAALIKVPTVNLDGEASTGPETHSNLSLSFQNQRLQSLNNDQFSKFLAAATDTPEFQFQLTGSAIAHVSTHIGKVQVTNIPLNVPDKLVGFNSFNHHLDVPRISPTSSTPEYIIIPLNVTIENPGNITLMSRDLFLPVFWKGVNVAMANIPMLNLVPGGAEAQVLAYVSPNDIRDPAIIEVIGLYVSPKNKGKGGTSDPNSLPLTVGGKPQITKWAESPYNSILPAMYGLDISATPLGSSKRPLLELDLIIDVIPALFNSEGTAILAVRNPVDLGVTIEYIECNVWQAGLENGPGAIRATVNQSVTPNVHIDVGATEMVSVTFTMTRGLIFSLDLLTQPLSVEALIEVGLDGGFQVPVVPLNEYDVRTTYLAEVLGIPINITTIFDFLPNILSVLNPEQITNDLLPALQQLPVDQVQAIAQGLNVQDPIVQFACNAVPILKGLPVCQPATGLHLRDLRRGIAERNNSLWLDEPYTFPSLPS